MRSETPKVAFDLLGKPLIRWVVDAASQASCSRIVTILGHGSEIVAPMVADTEVVYQTERLGTGHAVMAAAEKLAGHEGSVAVLSGDTPLVEASTIEDMARRRHEEGAAVAVLTQESESPFGYGRVIRDSAGNVIRIVEQKECTPEEDAVTECNSGIYCFDARLLFDALGELGSNNSQGEFYLTDTIAILGARGEKVIGVRSADPTQTVGINTLKQLAEATRLMQGRINDRHMDEGVSMLDPSLVWIGPDVDIGCDVNILPMTFLTGDTKVAAGSEIGPNTRITDSTVGRNCVVDESVLFGAVLEDDVTCGPRAYLRPGTVMRSGSKAGTHVEIKKSVIGRNAKVPHLSYIGDASLGDGVNIGAGAITCNYDGYDKFRTEIGDEAFIGSNALFVAPVSVGPGAVVAAGSSITKDVPADALGIERAEQVNKEGWAQRRRERKEGKGSRAQ
jgi:bifunctional UDP-N-acetylglucosamine pyrophosphorylase/glucosamine-1-phosphate N-acetyltransferase